MAYAVNTSVPIERSRAEIEKILEKHNATAFAYATRPELAQIQFEMGERRMKFNLPLPVRPQGSKAVAVKKWEQTCRSKWRALGLCIKAKLEAVESGITTLEYEFMAHIVLPDGRTLGEAVLPQVEESYRTNQMPPLLLGPSRG